METFYDHGIVYDQGAIWIKTDELEPLEVEMPSTSFKASEIVRHQDLLVIKNVIEFDSDSTDPLGVPVNDKSNESSLIKKEEPYSVVALKNFSRHYYEKNEMRRMNSRTFICAYCGFTVFIRKELKAHIFTHHKENLPVNQDHVCKAYLPRHHWEAMDNPTSQVLNYLKISRVFFCSNCEYKTIFPVCLRSHIENSHMNKLTFNCEHCGFKTNDFSYLNLHTLNQHGANSIIYCNHCDFKSISTKIMNCHLKKNHTDSSIDSNALLCQVCNFQATCPVSLKQHMRKLHSVNDVSSCPNCEYKTYDKANLKRHILARHALKPYACLQCDYRSNKKRELAVHLINKHKDLLENSGFKEEPQEH